MLGRLVAAGPVGGMRKPYALTPDLETAAHLHSGGSGHAG
jgi:hypothetical protein